MEAFSEIVVTFIENVHWVSIPVIIFITGKLGFKHISFKYKDTFEFELNK